MTHRSTRETVEDLRRAGRLVEIKAEIDPYLEAAEIQRRVYANQGPAILFSNLKGCRFPAVSNLFASLEQARFLFRDTLESVRRLIELKTDPSAAPKRPYVTPKHRGLLGGCYRATARAVRCLSRRAGFQSYRTSSVGQMMGVPLSRYLKSFR